MGHVGREGERSASARGKGGGLDLAQPGGEERNSFFLFFFYSNSISLFL
jgi:hypothetical protein